MLNLVAMLTFTVTAAMVQAEKLDIVIPAGPLEVTSPAFTDATGRSLLFDYRSYRYTQTRAVRCHCTRARALHLMLEGTGLTFDVATPSIFVAIPLPACAPDEPLAPPPPCLSNLSTGSSL